MSFESITYKGKPVKRDGFTGKLTTLILQKNNGDRLDMRYKCNKEFVELNRQHFGVISKYKPRIAMQFGEYIYE
jgi:hypothetical protein